MLKKRIIFTLLYSNGFFVQSRNFNLQIVGDINGLKHNYNFKKISRFIDELIIIDISRSQKSLKNFVKSVREISKDIFAPLTLGGGIDNFEKVKILMKNGADKILINSNPNNLNLIKKISNSFGNQSIIVTLDFKKENNTYFAYSLNGTKKINMSIKKYLSIVSNYPVGEIILNSIDMDGTGQGLDFKILNFVPKKNKKSIILSGGTGNEKHFEIGLKNKSLDAISTSNLLNFIGETFKNVRNYLINNQNQLPIWNFDDKIFKK